MLHKIIDAFALVVAILALIPLWREQKRRLIAVTGICLLAPSGIYLVTEYLRQADEERQREETIVKAESDIFTIVCRYPQGMSYDEIYQKIDRGSQEWTDTDAAFGRLVSDRGLTFEVKQIPSWDKKRTVPLSVWRVTDLSSCK